MVLIPLHATPENQPPPLTPGRLLTEWTWEWGIGVVLILAAGLYVWGLLVLRRKGVRWPVQRSVAFLLGGLGSAALATLSSLGAYDTVLFSVHMVQHMILMMLTPLLAALGAPVTLALRALPPRGRSVLVAILHSRVARVLTFPPLAIGAFIASPFALYYSPIYPLSLESPFWHTFVHLHFVLVGAMLMWPLAGVDPIPGRVSYPLRVLTLFVLLPFHAFLGISIMSSTVLIAEDWYLAFERSWSPSPLEDQYLAGAILWGSGDITALVLLVVMFVQWFRHSQREAIREDRRLDRLEAFQRRSGTAARYDRRAGDGHSTAPGPEQPGSQLHGPTRSSLTYRTGPPEAGSTRPPEAGGDR